MTTDTINKPSTDNRIFLNGKQLADVLDVSAPTVSDAARKGHNCAGYPVSEWAVETDSGRIKGYDVPEFLVSDATKQNNRPNPAEIAPESPTIRPNKANSVESAVEEAPDVINNSYSLLPEGEDYVRPVGMITLPSVLKKALEQDTPQSRAVIAGGLAALGALIGHAVTDNATGAGVGAGAALGIAILMYKYLQPGQDHSHLMQNFAQSLNKQQLGSTDAYRSLQSNFLPN